MTVMIVAAVGIVVNGATAWLFASGRKGDLNMRGAFLHMAADAAVSAGVVVAGLVILLTGWLWLDPVGEPRIVGLIVWGTWGLLRTGGAVARTRSQTKSSVATVEATRATARRRSEVHDLHIWAMSTTDNCAHRPPGCAGRTSRRCILMRAAEDLKSALSKPAGIAVVDWHPSMWFEIAPRGRTRIQLIRYARGTRPMFQSSDTSKKKKRNIVVRLLGPGLVTGAADDDPSGIATYSQAGAQFGYGLLWTVFLTIHS